MRQRKPLLLKPFSPVWPVSRGARIASGSNSSPQNFPSISPTSGPPLPSPRPSLRKSPCTPSPLRTETLISRRHRNPSFRRRRNHYSRGPRGAKLDSGSDLSPEKSPPKKIQPPSPLPPPRPDLVVPIRPSSPPAADDRYWVEERSRRLPHYFYRRFPAYFSPAGPSAVGVVAGGRVGVVWSEQRAEAESEDGDKLVYVEAEMEDGFEADIGDGEIPWCR